ncbi:MAG TPA: amino acid adenylation domain-containing protein, partial [Edaphobacter sp.]|nr:amino acid adenylation domain-containing protein [Edaphobacter sp.]
MQYADLCEWQHELLDSEEGKASQRTWREQKIPELHMSGLLSGWLTTEITSFRPRVKTIEIDRGLALALAAMAREYSTSLGTILLAGWNALLWRYINESPFPIVIYRENRRYAELATVLGPIGKNVLILSELGENITFRQLVHQLHEKMQQLDVTQEFFSWKHVLTKLPEFPFLFSYESRAEPISNSTLTFSIQSLYSCTAPFKAKLTCWETADKLVAEFHYDLNLPAQLDDDFFSLRFHELLRSAVKEAQMPIAALRITTEQERNRIVEEWNETATDLGSDRLLSELFEEQAARTPDAIAAIFEGSLLTYGELNRYSNQLAHSLLRRGARPDMVVGICMERSLGMVAALLGVLKAGAAYLPLDPSYPEERLRYMLQDAGTRILLVQEHLRTLLPDPIAEVISLESDGDSIAAESEENPTTSAEGQNLAYVIYTSGSTGNPKGVMISQRAILNRLRWMINQFPLDSSDAVLQKTAFSFDASIWEIFVPLFCGARLVVARPGGQQDSGYLVEMVRREHITVLQLVPSMLRVFLRESAVDACVRTLKRVFSGGEALAVEVSDSFQRRLPFTELINLYGPTETSIDVSSWRCDADKDMHSVPLGRPIANTQLYILDRNLEPVPAGVIAEIYIGGAGLARGYLGRSDLTAQKFVPDPFSKTMGSRLYMTGDLGRFREDGAIEYLGRADHQIKIHGYRVEPGEIEAILGRLKGVKESAVIVREDEPGDKRLIAYVVHDQNESVSADLRHKTSAVGIEQGGSTDNDREIPTAIWEYLKSKLPGYMVPATIVTVHALPRLSSGKVDRKSLPRPESVRQSKYVAPRNGIQEVLAHLWGDLLRLESVGINDNFFGLGGHSLLATQLVARVRDLFQIDIPLRQLFEQPTVEELAQSIELELGTGKLDLSQISRRDVAGGHELSYAQRRLWFLAQLQPDSPFYNLSAAVCMEGSLVVAALRRALNGVVKRHDSLRTRFQVGSDGEPEQVVAVELSLSIPVLEIDGT